MNICFATNYLPGYHSFWGGAEQVCYRLAKLLCKNSQDVSILSTKPDRPIKEDFTHYTIPVVEDIFPRSKRYYLGQAKCNLFPFDPVAYPYALTYLKRIKPDVLHLHSFGFLSFSLVMAASRLKIPMVFSVYDYWCVCPLGFTWVIEDVNTYKGRQCYKYHGRHCLDCLSFIKPNLIQRQILSFFLSHRRRFFDYFITRVEKFIILSQANSKVLEGYHIPKSKIEVVPIPISREEDNGTKVEDNLILYIGWLHPRKGAHVVVEAMAHVLKEMPEAKLLIFGVEVDAGYKARILKIISENNMQDNIIFMGKRPFKETKIYIKKASVLVIPEQWETIAPNILSEGLMFGKAIVASKIGGILDLIEDGKNGLLARADDARDFARKIISLLKDGALRMKLEENAKESSAKFCSEEMVYGRLLTLYGSLTNRRQY